MNKAKNFKENYHTLRKSGIIIIIIPYFFLLLQATIFFVSAGHINMPRAWLFFAISFISYSCSSIILYKYNPELLNQRGKSHQGAKIWDQVLMRVINLIGLLFLPFIAGLDVGRYQWSNINIYFALVGFVLYSISSIFVTWGMVVNKHFEPTVRIQKERAHKVIMEGPYKFMRHPGYFASVLFYIAAPLILGSLFAFIPVALAIVLLIIRTYLEDITLRKELKGYSQYAKIVKNRLFPGIW
jgi:protein-S-isoprenylcysteine O-methyltransferase Ste14